MKILTAVHSFEKMNLMRPHRSGADISDLFRMGREESEWKDRG